MSETYNVELIHIQKSFAGVKALCDASLRVKKGEIHALIGENGAGKSTMMKILSGAIKRDSGVVKVGGKEVPNYRPKDAKKLGISTIYQELVLAPDLTVAENIYMDTISKAKGLINWKKLNSDAAVLLGELGFSNIDPKSLVGDLPVAYQQVVEICKALSKKISVLILDEPTAVLTFKEIKKLFELLRKLRDDGVSIIYISHRLEEIFELSDRITVMKDGFFVDEVETKSIDKTQLVNMMVGRTITSLFPSRNATLGDTMLEVENMNRGKLVQNVSFSVKSGEVLGFYGLVGAGRTEMMRCITGADKMESGTIRLDGKPMKFRSPKEALKHKVGMLPENRKTQGVILSQSIAINTTIASRHKATNGLGILSKAKEHKVVKEVLASINTKYATVDHPVSSLSGGNQQKVVLAKWLSADCRCIIFDEPTRGVDVGAKVEIYQCVNRLAEDGLAVVMVSSEMTELLGMCDRIAVVKQGEIVGILPKEEASEQKLMQLAMGIGGE